MKLVENVQLVASRFNAKVVGRSMPISDQVEVEVQTQAHKGLKDAYLTGGGRSWRRNPNRRTEDDLNGSKGWLEGYELARERLDL